MTITLSPETEKALREAAARQGTTPDKLAEEAVKEKSTALLSDEQQEAEDLRARVKAARGMFSHISGGSYAFAAAKVYEKLLEERHW